VSISPTFYGQLFYAKVFFEAFVVLTVCLCNFLAKDNWRKSCLYYVDEIVSMCQFHQHFFEQLVRTKVLWAIQKIRDTLLSIFLPCLLPV